MLIKMFGTAYPNYYMVVTPYIGGWLILEDHWTDPEDRGTIQYCYLPHYKRSVQCKPWGIRIIYNDKVEYFNDCFLREIPEWVNRAVLIE